MTFTVESFLKMLPSSELSYSLINVQNGVVVSLLSFLCVCFILKMKGGKRQRKLPGPGQHFLGSIANILALRDMTRVLKVFENWCESYGPVFQVNFGPYSMVFLNSPEYIQKLLGSRDNAYLPKGFIYKPFKPVWKDGLGISTGDKWKFRRRVLTKHMFSFGTLASYMNVFNEEGTTLVNNLGQLFENGGEQEIEKVLMHSVLNVIAKAAFGRSVADFEVANGEPTFTEVVDGVKEIVAVRSLNPLLLWDPFWYLHPMSKRGELITKMAWKYAAKAAAVDIPGSGANGTKLGIKEDLTEAGVSLEGIVEESITLMSTGYETTSSSLHFVLFLLALHPEHQERCREEVDSLYEDEELCHSGNIQGGGLAKLKYLEMCVNETLRLLPTVFLTMRRIEAPLQLEPDLVIPAGTQVAVFAPGIHKNPAIYPEPQKFRPERFSEEQIKSRLPFAHIPFSGGPRVCIGYKFAMMELLTLTAKILRHYVISTPDKLEDIVFLPYITLTPQKRMKFSFKRRFPIP